LNIIYIRVSKENKTLQDPKQQLNAILKKFDIDKYELLEERGSAYNIDKIHKRKKFIELLRKCLDADKTTIEDLYLRNFKKKEINLYVWDSSRIMRNIELNMLFFILSFLFDVKVHSFEDKRLFDENTAKNSSARFLAIMQNLISAFLAEAYSEKIKEGVEKSFVNGGYSTYGNKWGGLYSPNTNWKEYWSETIERKKGKTQRLTKIGKLRVSMIEDLELKTKVMNLLKEHERSEVIEIIKKEKGIILSPAFISENFNAEAIIKLKQIKKDFKTKDIN